MDERCASLPLLQVSQRMNSNQGFRSHPGLTPTPHHSTSRSSSVHWKLATMPLRWRLQRRSCAQIRATPLPWRLGGCWRPSCSLQEVCWWWWDVAFIMHCVHEFALQGVQ